MKAIIYYFTGSGNTRIAAEDLKRHLDERGIQTTLYAFEVSNHDVPNPNDYDLIGIGYPIHAFNVPRPFLKFIKNLPSCEGPAKRVFIFKVSGEPFKINSSSSYWIYKHMNCKGYRTILEKHLLMPYNIIFSYPDAVAKQMYLYLDALSTVLSIKLLNNEEEKLHFSFLGHCFSLLVRIEWIAGPANALFFRVDRKKCVNCNLCLRGCPLKAIYRNKDGHLRAHSSCALCMRCTMACPTNAIHFGFMNTWKVNPGYSYEKLAKDSTLKGNGVNSTTRGHFGHFRKYFAAQDALLDQYHVPRPGNTEEEKYRA
jgi:ferredoxin/flavodoxin